MISCNINDRPIKAHYQKIEIICEIGWGGKTTISIDSLGIIKKCIFANCIQHIDKTTCFLDTLDYYTRDTLNIKIDKLKREGIDSCYNQHCMDCGVSIIKIMYDNKTIQSTIIGGSNSKIEILNFVEYILDLKIDKNEID